MLSELRIENFAIIDKLDLEFGPGLVTFTGETGAGKSIIIDAVETLLGVRADMTMMRSGVDRTAVEGTFRIAPKIKGQVQAILQREEMDEDGIDYVTLAREFRRGGRNSARVNGRTANLALLRELGELLIDLHGQSEHLSLLRVSSHLGLLDRFAESEKEFAAYRKVFDKLQTVRKELRELRAAESEAARRAELLTYQINEISAAAFQLGEEEQLKEERTRLANAESLASHANIALAAIDSGNPESPAAMDMLGQVLDALNALAKVDPSQAELSGRAQELFDGVSELAHDLGDYLESIEFNPKRLEEVEERWELLLNLKRKYGETIPLILAFGEKAQKDLDAITHAEERMAELAAQEAKLLKELAEKALALSAKRRAAADAMSRGVENELKDLRMEAAQFGVEFRTRPDEDGIELPGGEKVAFDSNGHESVEFLVAPNPGEGLKPMVKIASGGETARLMLALKNVLARADNTPTLIFDEIDQGIGGRVGSVVGQKLWNLGREHQVLCVTHLPQLAGYGDQHFKVLKRQEKGRTITVVEHLEGEARLMELAQMMGEVSEGTLQSAHEILQSVSQMTSAV